MERYIGELKSMPDPKFEEVEIVWMTNEQWTDPLSKYNPNKTHPSVWFLFEGILHHGISSYQFQWFETYEDFELPSGKPFDCWDPGIEEWEYLTNLGLQYRELDYQKAIVEGDLDNWCQFELDFATKWNRDRKIDDLLK